MDASRALRKRRPLMLPPEADMPQLVAVDAGPSLSGTASRSRSRSPFIQAGRASRLYSRSLSSRSKHEEPESERNAGLTKGTDSKLLARISQETQDRIKAGIVRTRL